MEDNEGRTEEEIGRFLCSPNNTEDFVFDPEMGNYYPIKDIKVKKETEEIKKPDPP